MKHSWIDFWKTLEPKYWLTIVILLLMLAATIWLAFVGSIDLARDLSTERSFGFSLLLTFVGTMIAGSNIWDTARYRSNKGRLVTVLVGALVFFLGVVAGIGLNSFPLVLIGGLWGLAYSFGMFISQRIRKVRK